MNGESGGESGSGASSTESYQPETTTSDSGSSSGGAPDSGGQGYDTSSTGSESYSESNQESYEGESTQSGEEAVDSFNAAVDSGLTDPGDLNQGVDAVPMGEPDLAGEGLDSHFSDQGVKGEFAQPDQYKMGEEKVEQCDSTPDVYTGHAPEAKEPDKGEYSPDVEKPDKDYSPEVKEPGDTGPEAELDEDSKTPESPDTDTSKAIPSEVSKGIQDAGLKSDISEKTQFATKFTSDANYPWNNQAAEQCVANDKSKKPDISEKTQEISEKTAKPDKSAEKSYYYPWNEKIAEQCVSRPEQQEKKPEQQEKKEGLQMPDNIWGKSTTMKLPDGTSIKIDATKADGNTDALSITTLKNVDLGQKGRGDKIVISHTDGFKVDAKEGTNTKISVNAVENKHQISDRGAKQQEKKPEQQEKKEGLQMPDNIWGKSTTMKLPDGTSIKIDATKADGNTDALSITTLKNVDLGQKGRGDVIVISHTDGFKVDAKAGTNTEISVNAVENKDQISSGLERRANLGEGLPITKEAPPLPHERRANLGEGLPITNEVPPLPRDQPLSKDQPAKERKDIERKPVIDQKEIDRRVKEVEKNLPVFIKELKDKLGDSVKDISVRKIGKEWPIYEIWAKTVERKTVYIPDGAGIPMPRTLTEERTVRIGGISPVQGEILSAGQMDSRDGVVVSEGLGALDYIMGAKGAVGIVKSLGKKVFRGLSSLGRVGTRNISSRLAKDLGGALKSEGKYVRPKAELAQEGARDARFLAGKGAKDAERAVASAAGREQARVVDRAGQIIDDQLAAVEKQIWAERARVGNLRANVDGKTWNRIRLKETKHLYNLHEQRHALNLKKHFPDRTFLGQTKITGIKAPDGTIHSIKKGQGRIADWAELKGNTVQLGEIKSPTAITGSVKGGIKQSQVIEGEFRSTSTLGKQLTNEQKIIDRARKVDGKIMLEGKDPLTGSTVRFEVRWDQINPSQVTKYMDFPN
ncbi:MAG: hypothetical protein HXS48_16465 [Theionarchaea archaeon]|nr:hypothetical protein [Theionarchaea archaeon]